MWRPSGIRVLDKMKRFFIGGVPEIEDLPYVAEPRDFQVYFQFVLQGLISRVYYEVVFYVHL